MGHDADVEFYPANSFEAAFVGGGGLKLAERSAAPTAIAGRGHLWVKDDAPNTAWFSDDAGSDWQLARETDDVSFNTIQVTNGVSALAQTYALEAWSSAGGLLEYPLAIYNKTGTNGSAAGMLFAVEGTSPFGKGALAYERKTGWARGDLHVLQNAAADSSLPALTGAVAGAEP